MNLRPALRVALLCLPLAACQRPEAAPEAPSGAPTAAPGAPAAPVEASPVELRLPGPFSPGYTVDAMRARFGEGHVRTAVLPLGEGDSERGVIVFPDDPARRLAVYFDDPQALTGVATVAVDDPASRWELDPGVRIGMTGEALVALNGAPISYAGFDWDASGYVLDWHGGRLAPAPGEPVRVVHLTLPADVREGIDVPLGDGSFNSDDPRYREAFGLTRVGEIGLRWPSAAAETGANEGDTDAGAPR